jgi:hypothetical protein
MLKDFKSLANMAAGARRRVGLLLLLILCVPVLLSCVPALGQDSEPARPAGGRVATDE